MIDHKDLLRRYIAHVRLCAEAGAQMGGIPAGIDLPNAIVGAGVPFSDVEIEELRRLADISWLERPQVCDMTRDGKQL